MKHLIMVASDSRDPVVPNIPWRKEFSEKIHCPKCYSLDRSLYPKPIDVVLDNEPKCISGGVSFTGIAVFHRNFIEQISEHLTGFVLGTCLDPYGNVYNNYLTCYRDSYIIIRGNKKTRYQVCDKCGSIDVEGRAEGIQYVLKSYLTEEKVYQDCSCFMYLDEDLAFKIDFSQFTDAVLDPIQIRESPIDGQNLPTKPIKI